MTGGDGLTDAAGARIVVLGFPIVDALALAIRYGDAMDDAFFVASIPNAALWAATAALLVRCVAA
jgi:hypothetical protein